MKRLDSARALFLAAIAITLAIAATTLPAATPASALPAGCTITVNSSADNSLDDSVVTLRDAISFATDAMNPAPANSTRFRPAST